MLPDGIEGLGDLPFTVQDGIQTALLFLSWEELPDDETPPKRIWGDPVKLQAHFQWVKRKREAEYGGKDEAIKDKPIDGDVTENDAAGLLING